MRLIRLIPAALILLTFGPSFAQDWITYVSREDSFSVGLPGEPEVKDITYLSELGGVFPTRVYSYQDGSSDYSVTVVDYTDTKRIHAERPNKFEADARSTESGHVARNDVRGSIAYAAWNLRRRASEVTYDAWSNVDLIEGHQLQLTNADQSRTFAGIYLHENRLYILEATVPAGWPPPGEFQQSLYLLDEKGNRIRYESLYSNGFPKPPRKR